MLRAERGFTLIELFIAVLVFAIVVAIGVPSFQATILNNRLIGQANELLTAISLARSEAMKRGARVALCRSANPSAATPACSTSGDWEGWLVFALGTANASSPSVYQSANDTLLKVGTAGTGITIKANSSAATSLVYRSDGTLAGGEAHFSLCDSRGDGSGRQIVIKAIGRARVSQDFVTGTDCSNP